MPNDTPATVKPSFTTNIRLDDGSTTMQDGTEMVEDHPWFKGTERVLKALLKRPISETSIVDLGCLNGAYATGFARLGYNVCGIEVRQSNFDACQYVKS